MLEKLLACAILFTTLFQIPGMSIIPLAAIFSLAIIPVCVSWIGPPRSVILWTAALLGSGLVLALTVPGGVGQTGKLIYVSQTAGWVVGIAITVLGGVWALQRVGTATAFALIAAGATISAFVQVENLDNWWKFGGATGVTLALFAFAERLGRLPVAFVAAALVYFNLMVGFRSMAILCFIVFVVRLLSEPIARIARMGRITLGLVVGAGGLGIAHLFNYVISSGLAGTALKQRSDYQTALGQNPILGGRTEWGATIELMKLYFPGFGAGTVPSGHSITSAINAAQVVGGDVQGPYFFVYVFGARVDLHSSVANLWYHFGIVGLITALAILIMLFSGITKILSTNMRYGSTLMFVCLIACWDLLFSPMVDSSKIGLAISFVYVYSTRSTSKSDTYANPDRRA